jgi:integrase/recombinase XerD
MSSLQTALDEYLAVRRALGYKLLLEGRLLRRFIEFAKHARASASVPSGGALHLQ